MRVILSAAVAASFLLSSPVRAQDPAQIFGLILGEVERHADRARQREWQREQRRLHDANWQQFLMHWRGCFDDETVEACDAALATPGIAADNHSRLKAKRAAVLADKIAKAEDKVRSLEAAQQRLREARREIEEQRRSERRAYIEALADCRRFRADACDRALGAKLGTDEDRARILAWKLVADQFALDREACRNGSIEACDRAVVSAAAGEEQRRLIVEWRRAASPMKRFTAAVTDYVATTRDFVVAIPREIAALPRSTQIAASLAVLFAGALGIMIRRQRVPQVAASSSASPTSGEGSAANASALPIWRRVQAQAKRLHRVTFRFLVRRIASVRRRTALHPSAASSAAMAAPDRPRDPETAIAALQLARAYLAEFDGKITEFVDDPVAGKVGLNTLSLVSQQLAIAERADPSATLEVELENGASVTFSLAELKAEALYVEAICRSSEKPRRAIAILEQAAALDPSDTRIPYFAGLLHMDLMQKRAAIAAFERALTIDPDNMQFRKMLVRAQSLTGVEVAYHKAATGVRFGVKTARVISLLLQLAPFTLLVVSAFMAAFATTPATAMTAIVLFSISAAMSIASMLYRRTKRWLSIWYRENAF